jgi:stage II sporulation protein D
VCTDSSCCQAYTTKEDAAERWASLAEEYTAKISAAVADTDGVIATYDGQPIQAVFFSSAAGATEDAAAVWGNSLPYLVSVDSPEGDEVPNYRSEVTLTADEVRALVAAAYPGADLSGPVSGWFSNVTYTASGRVAAMDIGGVTLSGGAARNLFSLRSAFFQVETGEDSVTFSVTGYGHGVGLSQYGANAMAQAGSGWQEILEHYYTGVTLDTL